MYVSISVTNTCYPVLQDEIFVLLRLFVLLYADDTVLLSENELCIQRLLYFK